MDAIKTMLNAIKVFVADRYLTKKEAEETYLKEIPETDLSDYATKVFVADRYLTKKEAEETYLKEIPETDLSDYATKTYVDEVLGVIENGSY